MNEISTYAIPGFREPVSCFSHLFAAPIFAILGILLVHQGRKNTAGAVSLAIMVVSTVFLLSMSGVYHLLSEGTARYVMQRLDVSGVFALIAGTVTPVHTILFRGFHRWVPLALVWTCAAMGITLRNVFPDGLAPGIGPAIFLMMGWGGLFSCVVLWRKYGFPFVKPLLAGGVAYTCGAVVLVLHRPTLIHGVVGPHELWHFAVLAGLGLHWRFVWQFCRGMPNVDSHSVPAQARQSSLSVSQES